MSFESQIYVDILLGVVGLVLAAGLLADSLTRATQERTPRAANVQRIVAVVICLSWTLFAGLLLFMVLRVR